MKYIEAGVLLVLLSASSIVYVAIVVLYLFSVSIRTAITKRAAEPLGLDN